MRTVLKAMSVGCFRWSWISGLMLGVILFTPHPGHAQDRSEPPVRANPFAGDGFLAEANPFAVWADPEQRREYQIRQSLNRAVELCARRQDQGYSAIKRYDATLRLLEYACQTLPDPEFSSTGIHSLGILYGFVAWSARLQRRVGGETVPEILERHSRLVEADRDDSELDLLRCEQEYRRLASKPWPMDWRRSEAFWLTVVRTFSSICSGEDTRAAWRELAEAFPDRAMVCRLAHLVSVRSGHGDQDLDFDFVQPLVAKSKSRIETTLIIDAQVLAALLAEEGDRGDGLRERFQGDLLTLLSEHASNPQVFEFPHVIESVADVYWETHSDTELRRCFLQTLLIHGHPRVFDRFASEVRLSQPYVRQLRLARPMSVDTDNRPLSSVLGVLQENAAISLWIDDSVRDADATLAIGQVEGPWLEVLERIADAAEFRMELLDADQLWVGQPEAFAAAQEVYEYGVVKSQRCVSATSQRLAQPASVEFTEQPLTEVLDQLGQQYDVWIESSVAGDRCVTMKCQGLPLHLCLSRLAIRVGGHWCASGSVVFLGSEGDVGRIREAERDRLRRWMRLGLADTDVTRALREDTRLEFIQSPMKDVAGFLSDVHDIPLRLLPGVADTELTIKVRNVTLEDALDVCLVMQAGLAWYTDGQTIWMGTAEEIQALVERESTPAPGSASRESVE